VPLCLPRVSRPLAWNGACDRCRGSDTPEERDTWTFPGDYCEPVGDPTDPSYGHHVRRYKGPTPAPTLTEVDGYLQELRERLAKITAKQASEAAPDR
jgi:hypothetical protein